MSSVRRSLLLLGLLAISAGVGFLAARLRPGAAGPPSGSEGTAPLEEPVFERRPVTSPLSAARTELPPPPDPSMAPWAERNRRAIAHLGSGELEEAIALLEECVEAVPLEEVFQRNLGEALVRLAARDHEALHPCAHCCELLVRAIDLDPGREDLPLLLARWRKEAEAEADFWRESSLHFDLAYDGSRDEILWGSHRILAELEEAYGDLGLLFGRYPVEEGGPRMAVVLYRREGFDALTGLGDWAGGAFDGTVRVPVGDFRVEEEGLRRILRHELVHAFVRAVGGPRVPGWLNEGLAQWLEEGSQLRIEAAREGLAGGELFPLEALEGSLATWEDEAAISRAYAQSLLLCEHLAHDYGERVLYEMVEGCGEGREPGQVFHQLTRVPIETAVGDLAQGLRAELPR